MPRPHKIDVYLTKKSVSPVGIRYGTQEMVRLFGEPSRLETMLNIESVVSGVISRHYPTKVPQRAVNEIKKKASLQYVKIRRVREIEAKTRHDVMSVVKALAEQCEGNSGRYVHYGLTSADITESTKALQMKRGLEILINHVEDLRDVCLEKAHIWRKIPCIIRTHGLHAIPGVFGLPFAFFAYCLEKSADRLFYDYNTCLEGKISGAIGAFNVLTDEEIDGFLIEEEVFRELGIRPAVIASQSPPRENVAYIIDDIAVLAGTLANIANYIRELRKTEICELLELREEDQVGSSTMPHKDIFGGNPFIEERICSIARVLRGFATSAQESVEMEYARDLKSSLLDRIVIPESFILVDYAIKLIKNIIERVEPQLERIQENLCLTYGVVIAERVMSRLIIKGMSRQDAHKKISKLSLKAFKEEKAFKDIILLDDEISKSLSRSEIEELSNPHTYIGKSVDLIAKVVSLYKGKRRMEKV